MPAKKVKIITHNGSFHPDDSFAVASLLLYLEGKPVETEIIRTRDESQFGSADFVVDVGEIYDPEKNRFDHHQEMKIKRPNGIPYAAFGLVWKKFGAEICGKEWIAAFLDEKLVQGIDGPDNGVDLGKASGDLPSVYSINDAIYSFLPTWKSQRRYDEAFLEAVAFAKGILSREIGIQKDAEEGRVFVEAAYREAQDKRLIVLDKEYSWKEVMARYPEPLIVVFPQNGHFHAKAVRQNLGSFRTKIDFPEAWAGKRAEALQQISGVRDAVFCHKNRFLVVANSRDGAIALAKKTLGM